MTQKERVLNLFELHNGIITLGEILSTQLAAEYRRLFTDMRKEGYWIECIQNKDNKNQNKYFLLHVPFKSPYKGKLANKKIARAKVPQDILQRQNEAIAATYDAIADTYPDGHKERKKINKQINKLKLLTDIK